MNFIHKNDEIYLISCLNTNSVTLAESIRNHDINAVIIFTNVKPSQNGYSELCRSARRLKCRLTEKDIRTVNLSHHNPEVPVRAILAGDDEASNLSAALTLTEKFRNAITAEIYVFSSTKESECMLDSIDKGKPTGKIPPVKVRRVNLIRTLIYTDLIHNSLFDRAVTEYNEKIISVLIVGMGSYGTEMLKSVLWCGQMPGYVLKVNVIDKSPDAESRFYMQCPGIRSRGDRPIIGEDYYEINFFDGVDVHNEEFLSIVRGLSDTTFAFVALGDEQANIETAITLRSVFSGLKIDSGIKPPHGRDDIQTPKITTVVHNDDKSRLLNQNRISNFKGQYYNIDAIGGISDLYSYDNVFSPHLEKIAFNAHKQWGDADSFNNYEYNRRSSVASAIHKKYRDALLPDDADLRAMAEHMRWNAYIRSTEGYSFGYVCDDLALRHSSLVKYSLLSSADKQNDERMNLYVIESADKKS